MLPTLITIALLHWAILILPGFNFILVGQLAASGQRTTAMFAVAGMTTATLVWACLAVAGVGMYNDCAQRHDAAVKSYPK